MISSMTVTNLVHRNRVLIANISPHHDAPDPWFIRGGRCKASCHCVSYSVPLLAGNMAHRVRFPRKSHRLPKQACIGYLVCQDILL